LQQYLGVYFAKTVSLLKRELLVICCAWSAHSTWYGGQEPRCFWEYVRVACQRVPHNCLASIEALETPHTPAGKVPYVISSL